MKKTSSVIKKSKGKGGQAGMRGYLVQTLIALLEILLDGEIIEQIIIEPDAAAEKFDLFISYNDGSTLAMQVKSSEGQFRPGDVKTWATELRNSGHASRYRLCLVGLHSSSVADIKAINDVELETKNLDLEASREQCAHRLDYFLRRNRHDPGTPVYREMLVDALTARLAIYGTKGKPTTASELSELLASWIREEPNPSFNHALSAFRIYANNSLQSSLSQSTVTLKYNAGLYVIRELENDIEKWISARRNNLSQNCFLILAPAGCGKTNLLCRVASESARHRATLLLTGAQLRLDPEFGLWRSVFDGFATEVQIEPRRNCLLQWLKSTPYTAGPNIVIVIDAINEYQDPSQLRQELKIFIAEARECGVLVILSCRDYYWGLFDAPWWNDAVRAPKSDGGSGTKRMLGNFSPEESFKAFKQYFRQYQVGVLPEGNAREQLRHPLLLRFFCETHQNSQIGKLRDIRLKDLFDTYWETKLASIAERLLDQSQVGTATEISEYIGQSILEIARRMLEQDKRAITVSETLVLTRSDTGMSKLNQPYGRILDEHIILEELSPANRYGEKLVAFVFEEFMEYAMARSLMNGWQNVNSTSISADVVALTSKYKDFSQVFGVLLYSAIMLKEYRNVELWPVLIGMGSTWERVIIEAFKKLPNEQIDDGVFSAIIELLKVPRVEIKIEALELLKFGRLKRIPTPELIESVGLLVTHEDLRVRRRAILALASCPASFAIPLLEKSIVTRPHRLTDEYVVVRQALMALAAFQTDQAITIIARARFGYWHGGFRKEQVGELLATQLSTISALANSEEFLVRIGAITLLGNTGSADAIPIVESILAQHRKASDRTVLNQLPNWVNETNRDWIRRYFDSAEKASMSIEQYLAGRALSELQDELSTQRNKETWSELVKKSLAHAHPGAIPSAVEQMIAASHYDPKLVVEVIKKGLEFRSKRSWYVHGKFNEIKIKASRAKEHELTLEQQEEIKKLFGVEHLELDGLIIGNSSWQMDYWKEYIYRAWGVTPLVYGYSESWD